MDKLQSERSELANTQLQMELETLESGIRDDRNRACQLQQQLEAVLLRIAELRPQIKHLHDQLHVKRAELQRVNGKITSLELLQQHAMGKDKKDLSDWLEIGRLWQQPRLAEFIEAEKGWENAVETVLGSYLEAICMESAETILDELQEISKQSLIIFETNPAGVQAVGAGNVLLHKVHSRWDLSGLLSGIYCADSMSQARRDLLAAA